MKYFCPTVILQIVTLKIVLKCIQWITTTKKGIGN